MGAYSAFLYYRTLLSRFSYFRGFSFVVDSESYNISRRAAQPCRDTANTAYFLRALQLSILPNTETRLLAMRKKSTPASRASGSAILQILSLRGYSAHEIFAFADKIPNRTRLHINSPICSLTVSTHYISRNLNCIVRSGQVFRTIVVAFW